MLNKPFVLPNDWETWEKLPAEDCDDGHWDLPVEEVHYDSASGVMVFKHPIDGDVWINTADSFVDQDGDWHEGEWVKYVEMKEDQRQAVEEISVILDEIKVALRTAVNLAKKAGIRLHLEKEFRLVNVEPDGHSWVTSNC